MKTASENNFPSPKHPKEEIAPKAAMLLSVNASISPVKVPSYLGPRTPVPYGTIQGGWRGLPRRPFAPCTTKDGRVRPLSQRHFFGSHNVYDGLVLRELDEGPDWGTNPPLYRQLIQQLRPTVAVEVGVWRGATSLAFADSLRNLSRGRAAAGLASTMRHQQRGSREQPGVVVSVDTWLGAAEFWPQNQQGRKAGTRTTGGARDLILVNGFPSIYYSFLSNVVRRNLTDYIVPFPVTSLVAAEFFRRDQFRANLVHVDASHAERDVANDLEAWWPLVADGGILMGDDYDNIHWKGLVRAVDAFVVRHGVTLECYGLKWLVRKPCVGGSQPLEPTVAKAANRTRSRKRSGRKRAGRL